MPDTVNYVENEVDESILLSVAKKIGLEPDDIDDFKTDLLMDINAIIFALDQVGIGPSKLFVVKDVNDKWTDYIDWIEDIEMVKSYIAIRVKLMFDPPNNSFLVNTYENLIKEFEWRMNMDYELHKDRDV